MIQAIEAIHRKQLNDVGNGEYTVTYTSGGVTGVLSCNPPDGHFTIMPKGAAGPYERCKISGGSLAFAPPHDGPLVAYFVPYAPDIPNG
jgi:hypothetical protein